MTGVVILDTGCCNLTSLCAAVRRLGVDPIVTDKPEVARQAQRLFLPGVGTAQAAMRELQKRALAQCIREAECPVLGICLGMQLMCKHSEEGNVDCLGIFDAEVKRFQPLKHEDKIPHMGWNTISHTNSDLFRGFNREEYVYFVHSYYVPLNDCTAAQTDYILPYSSALHKDNFYATQFHPEKSGKNGERILTNFLDL